MGGWEEWRKERENVALVGGERRAAYRVFVG
jgi:hypothetical protein